MCFGAQKPGLNSHIFALVCPKQIFFKSELRRVAASFLEVAKNGAVPIIALIIELI
jgi:hypothetical protein